MTTEHDDFWTDPSLRAGAEPARAPAPVMGLTTINDVLPLDAQFGVSSARTVPACLQDALFGDPGGSAGAPLGTFAVLDGARISGLPEYLETSGLQHRCLFTGKAEVEMREVAPWIVRLHDDNAFVRNLFTRGAGARHHWDKRPGIYLRSRADLPDVWRHFRRFTKVQDDAGTWFHLRFWEPEVLLDLATCLEPVNALAFFGEMRFVVPDKAGAVHIVERHAS